MANLSELNTTQIVGKFISSSAVKSNPSEQIRNLINSIATSFLLHPQITLSFVIKCKNQLMTNVNKEITLLNDLLKRMDYLNNKEVAIKTTSSLVEAQTILLELDRLGTIDSKLLNRYNTIIKDFANKHLTSVKSGLPNEMRLNSDEAKEDIYVGLASFLVLHEIIKQQITYINNAINNYNETELTKLVSRNVVSNVRTSLTDLKQQIDNKNVSKISTLIELISGGASLSSIAAPYGLLDPTIKTGVAPPGTKITATTAPAAATFTTPTAGPWTSTAAQFSVKANDEARVNISFPASGVNQRPFIVSTKAQGNYNIPANTLLYLRLTIPAGRTPNPLNFVNQGGWIVGVPITAGAAVTYNTIALDIEAAGLIGDDLFGLTRFWTVKQFGNTNNYQFTICGLAGVTKIEVLGIVDTTWIIPNPVLPKLSCHEELGFQLNQTSAPINTIDPALLSRCINLNTTALTSAVVNSKIVITSNSTGPDSKLEFFSGIATDVGFPVSPNLAGNPVIILPKPPFITLSDRGSSVRLENVDAHIGYQVELNGTTATITDVTNDTLIVDREVAPGVDSPIIVYSDLGKAVVSLLNVLSKYSTVFNNDTQDLNLGLTPVISSTPTNAQIADARKLMLNIVSRLQALKSDLETVPVTGTKSLPEVLAKQIISSLESRNLDKLIDLLNSCQFKEFFNSTPDQASSGTSLMKAMEEIGQNDIITAPDSRAATQTSSMDVF